MPVQAPEWRLHGLRSMPAPACELQPRFCCGCAAYTGWLQAVLAEQGKVYAQCTDQARTLADKLKSDDFLESVGKFLPHVGVSEAGLLSALGSLVLTSGLAPARPVQKDI